MTPEDQKGIRIRQNEHQKRGKEKQKIYMVFPFHRPFPNIYIPKNDKTSNILFTLKNLKYSSTHLKYKSLHLMTKRKPSDDDDDIYFCALNK